MCPPTRATATNVEDGLRAERREASVPTGRDLASAVTTTEWLTGDKMAVRDVSDRRASRSRELLPAVAFLEGGTSESSAPSGALRA